MWTPISREHFDSLVAQQLLDFDDEVRAVFDKFRVAPYYVSICRSQPAGNEAVFVVACNGEGVLYFDDVEFGFNFSALDDDGRLLRPGGSQMDLADAIRTWLTSGGK